MLWMFDKLPISVTSPDIRWVSMEGQKHTTALALADTTHTVNHTDGRATWVLELIHWLPVEGACKGQRSTRAGRHTSTGQEN